MIKNEFLQFSLHSLLPYTSSISNYTYISLWLSRHPSTYHYKYKYLNEYPYFSKRQVYWLADTSGHFMFEIWPIYMHLFDLGLTIFEHCTPKSSIYLHVKHSSQSMMFSEKSLKFLNQRFYLDSLTYHKLQ